MRKRTPKKVKEALFRMKVGRLTKRYTRLFQKHWQRGFDSGFQAGWNDCANNEMYARSHVFDLNTKQFADEMGRSQQQFVRKLGVRLTPTKVKQ